VVVDVEGDVEAPDGEKSERFKKLEKLEQKLELIYSNLTNATKDKHRTPSP